MSYDIDLCDPVTGETIEFDFIHEMKGGTYEVGGTNRAHLNITYNYAEHFYRVFDIGDVKLGAKGIRTIYGMTGAKSIAALQMAICRLDGDASQHYWEPTEGNAKRALCQLLALAQLRPDGVWSGD